MAIGQGPAEPAQARHIGVTRGRPQDQRVPAAGGELDPVTGRQVIELRAGQRQVPAIEVSCLAPQQRGNRPGELSQPLGPVPRRWPLPADPPACSREEQWMNPLL